MKEDINNKNRLKKRRVKRSRAKLFGTAEMPRLAVFKSLKSISVQAIDDTAGQTLAMASGLGLKSTGKVLAREVGKELATRLLAKKISQAVFDKRHYRYHGLIKELAEGAREAGLKF